MKKVIYVAGPYRAETEWQVVQNIRRAEETALELWKMGWVVICPHKNTAMFGGALPDEVILEGDLELLRRCDAIYLMKGWQLSDGASREREYARHHNMPLFNADWQLENEDIQGFLERAYEVSVCPHDCQTHTYHV